MVKAGNLVTTTWGLIYHSCVCVCVCVCLKMSIIKTWDNVTKNREHSGPVLLFYGEIFFFKSYLVMYWFSKFFVLQNKFHLSLSRETNQLGLQLWLPTSFPCTSLPWTRQICVSEACGSHLTQGEGTGFHGCTVSLTRPATVPQP